MATIGDQEPANPNQSPPSPQIPLPEQIENQPNWLDLPREITLKILLKLGAVEILLNAQSVCSQWRSICKDPSMWRNIHMRTSGDYEDLDYDLNKMCRVAVDRSSGGLYSINLEYFPCDETLEYITDRCKNIRCLQLMSCREVCDDGLLEAVKRLPCLEELDLTNCSFSAETIKSVGRSCTHLKSFKLNNPYYKSSAKGDAEAIAIANSMHQLHHLQLFKSKMTNVGLKAILDGCPHLKSLDLRRCVNVNLEGSLGKRCAEMIKNLQLPCDSTIDYPYTDEHFQEDQSDYEDDYDHYEDGYAEDYGELFPAGYFYGDWGAGYLEYDDFTILNNDLEEDDDFPFFSVLTNDLERTFLSIFDHDCSLTDSDLDLYG